MLHFLWERQASALLRDAQVYAQTINETYDLHAYFDSYNKLIFVMKRLTRLEAFISFYGTPPHISLAEIKSAEKRNLSLKDLIERCIRASCWQSEEEAIMRFSPYQKWVDYNFLSQTTHNAFQATRITAQRQEAYRARLRQAREVERKEKQRLQEQLQEEQRQRQAALDAFLAERQLAQEAQQKQECLLEERRKARAELLRAFSGDELLSEAASYCADQTHITADSLREYLPGVGGDIILNLIHCLSALHILTPTATADVYLCLMTPAQLEEFSRDLHGFEGQYDRLCAPAVPLSVPAVDIDHMEGHAFEHFCAQLLRHNGFQDVQVTQASGDYGVDILAEKDGVTYAVQYKCYTEPVGNHAVQEAHSGAAYYHRMVAAVMTNNRFTPAARETARELNVLLWDGDAVRKFTQELPG